MGVPTTVFVPIRAGRHAADRVEAFRAAIVDLPEIVEAHRLDLFDVAAYISMETLKLETSVPTDYAP